MDTSRRSAVKCMAMTDFDKVWSSAQPRNGGKVSPELQPLLLRVYSDVLAVPVNLSVLKQSLIDLLEYLSGAGRTNANCWAVDLFFCSESWEEDWSEQSLPDEFHDVFALMGQALHDTVQSPDIASNFDCLPEQLLERVKRLRPPIGEKVD